MPWGCRMYLETESRAGMSSQWCVPKTFSPRSQEYIHMYFPQIFTHLSYLINVFFSWFCLEEFLRAFLILSRWPLSSFPSTNDHIFFLYPLKAVTNVSVPNHLPMDRPMMTNNSLMLFQVMWTCKPTEDDQNKWDLTILINFLECLVRGRTCSCQWPLRLHYKNNLKHLKSNKRGRMHFMSIQSKSPQN